MRREMEQSNVVLYPRKDSKPVAFIDGFIIESDELISKAIESSTKAFKEWHNNPSKSAIFKNVSEALIVKLETLLDAAKVTLAGTWLDSDVSLCSQNFAYFSKLIDKFHYSRTNLHAKGLVCASILADCPVFSVLSWITAAPLAGGNCVVLLVKSSYIAVAVCFAIILHEAGLPSGVLNVIPFIDKESLAGFSANFSKMIGIVSEKYILPDGFHWGSVLVKKNSLCPMLVLKSADIDSSIDCIMNCTQYNEVLWFPNVIYVEEPIFEKFENSLRFAVKKYSASRELVDINFAEFDATSNKMLNEKRNQGAKVIEFNRCYSKCVLFINDDSALESPVVTSDSDKNNSVRCHWISVLPVKTVEEGVSFVNAYSGGLAASVWSNDAVEIMSLPFKLNYGTVWVNSVNRYSPRVSLVPWLSFGFGTFSGKRSLFETLSAVSDAAKLTVDDEGKNQYYPAERNSVFPKKNMTAVIRQSSTALNLWNKEDRVSKANFLDDKATLMEANWNFHFKIVLENSTLQTWKKCIEYLNFWSSYTVDGNNNETYLYDDCCFIVTKSEPAGIIAFAASNTPLDVLIFAVAAALIYGNSMIVGLSAGEQSSVTARELENLFSDRPGLVSVIVDDDRVLWKHFTSNETISTVWFVKNCSEPLEKGVFKNVIGIDGSTNMIEQAEFFEFFATKQKSAWLPTLF